MKYAVGQQTAGRGGGSCYCLALVGVNWGGGGARVKESACVSVAAPGAEGRTEAGGVEERRGRAQRRRIP